jgi:hypothetical protein
VGLKFKVWVADVKFASIKALRGLCKTKLT